MTKSELTILQQELDVALDRFQRTLRARFRHPAVEPKMLKPPVPDTPTPIIPKTIPPAQSSPDKTNQEQSTKPRMLHYLVTRLLQYFKRK